MYKSAEEFAADESFQEYCLGKSGRSTRKWEKYLKKNKHKSTIIEEAKLLLMFFSVETQEVSKNTSRKWSIKRAILLKACAVLIAVSTICGFLYALQDGEIEFETITKTAEGQHQSILLSDLTNVELRKNSTLKFKESWDNSNSRSVSLNGEAYFDVRKSIDNKKPFEVKLEQGRISVLGTKFLVKSTPSFSQIILEEGLIVYHVDEKKYELLPGDVLRYNDEMVSIHRNKEIKTYDSWRRQVLDFQNTPIEEIINTINNSYDLKVSLGNQRLKNKKITTTVNQNDPILLLQAIAAIYEMDIDIKEPKIVLK